MRHVDTSVLIAYLTRETGSDVAEAFMRSQGEPLAISSWTEVELLSALGPTARHGHTASVRAILNAGPKIEQGRADGWDALLFAHAYGHTGTVQALLDAGANKGVLSR